jgi:hypothetical protein
MPADAALGFLGRRQPETDRLLGNPGLGELIDGRQRGAPDLRSPELFLEAVNARIYAVGLRASTGSSAVGGRLSLRALPRSTLHPFDLAGQSVADGGVGGCGLHGVLLFAAVGRVV